MPTEQDAETVRQGHALIADTFLGEHQPASRLSHGVASRVARGGACLRRNKLEFRCAMRRANPPALVNILYTGLRCACDADSARS